MKSARFSLFAVLLVLLAIVPVSLYPQGSIIVRPRFDESPSSQRGLYPHKVVKRPRIGLVLTGGGARGVAQIGVLRVLERHNIPVDLIVATSLGAVVGGLYASGYTPAELESLALGTYWDEVLSLGDESKRTDLFIDQKIADDRSFLAIRFQGLEPVIPSAVSSGQRLTDFLSTQTLQSLYHPDPSFDDLKIPFRTVSTDLISGRRIILKEGSLSEALRASATVPMLFNPVERDSMQLIDGGLVSNIPVDVARDEGADIVIVVNSTSGLRDRNALKAPWQTADQIMGIMMQSANEQQLARADIVITPDIGKHLSSDFQNLDSLIRKGEEAAEAMVDSILALYERTFAGKMDEDYISVTDVTPVTSFENIHERAGTAWWTRSWSVTKMDGNTAIPDSILKTFKERSAQKPMTLRDVTRQAKALYATGRFSDVYAEVNNAAGEVHVRFNATPNPDLTQVMLTGCRLIPEESVVAEFIPMMHAPFNPPATNDALERVLRLYRTRGYSLARIDSVAFDATAGTLNVALNEGIISKIDVQGGVRTQDYYLLREFPLDKGDVFEIKKANEGLVNINSTKLYEYVYLEVSYPGNQPILTIRLKERPSQLVRLGVRADNERNLQGSIDIRDENFHGTGAQLGFTFVGGGRNRDLALEYKALRMFESYLTFSVGTFYSIFDTHVYGDAPTGDRFRWERQRIGEYRDIRYGGKLMFGSQLERLGNATIELNVQKARIKNLENMEGLEEELLLSLIRIGTMIDTKDSYPFPRFGVGLNLQYEISSRRLGSDVGYNALKVMYESYSSWGRHTLHPKVTLGVADRTMPLGQQFRLGGRESLYGVNEDDRRGRQMLLVNLEYRFWLPFRLAFDSYLRLRYDLGSISTVPEEIKLGTFRHGVGAEIAIDTPVGPAIFGVGKGFQFVRDLPQNPVQQGPFLLYFLIGYQL